MKPLGRNRWQRSPGFERKFALAVFALIVVYVAWAWIQVR